MIKTLRSHRNTHDGSLEGTEDLSPKNYNLLYSCNPLKERIQDYDESWDWLGRLAIEYNWKYRKKICTKCTRQEELKCHKIDNFRIIDNVKIQETHCSKLENARANKLRNHVKHVLALNPFSKY